METLHDELVALAYNIATVDEDAPVNKHWLRGAIEQARRIITKVEGGK